MYLYHFAGIVLIIYLSVIRERLLRSNNDLLIFVGYFLSTTMHELAHYIMALLTYGKPIKFTILPKKEIVVDDDGNIFTQWTLGKVVATNVNFVNAPLIGLAPLLLFVLAYYIYMNFFIYVEQSITSVLLFYVLLYICIANSIPSSQDIKVAINNYILTIALYVTIGVLTYYVFV